MKYENLGENIVIKTVSETDKEGIFEIEGLYTGYGITIGNALRRALLSSIPGAAITQFKLKGANHEFTALSGVIEDVVELSLNLKRVRFRLYSDEPQVLSLKFKGEGEVLAKEIKITSEVDLINPDCHIASLTDKNSELDMELTIERGLGYVPAEVRKTEKLSIGVIALDALFSPVVKVNFAVEHMRVGDRTDYNRLRITVGTDGSIMPSEAMKKATLILREHFDKITSIAVSEMKPAEIEKPKKTLTRKRAARKKE